MAHGVVDLRDFHNHCHLAQLTTPSNDRLWIALEPTSCLRVGTNPRKDRHCVHLDLYLWVRSQIHWYGLYRKQEVLHEGPLEQSRLLHRSGQHCGYAAQRRCRELESASNVPYSATTKIHQIHANYERADPVIARINPRADECASILGFHIQYFRYLWCQSILGQVVPVL